MAGTLGYKFKPGDPQAVSLSAATATTAVSKVIPMQDCRHTVWTAEGTGTISSGEIVIETADRQDYSGPWHILDTIAYTSVASSKSYYNGIPAAGSGFIRARISTNIGGGGSVTVRINGLLA